MESIKIHEVGLRDGLQNEKIIIPTEIKIKWTEILLESGVDCIQLGSFVHPERMPQMADTDKLFEYFSNHELNNKLSGLILNHKGLERGLKCGTQIFCLGVSASETHSLKNTGMSIEKAQDVIVQTADEARNAGRRVQVSVQSAFGCGFEGKVPEDKVLKIIYRYIDAGFLNISLADTAGHAYPEQVKRLFAAVKKLNDKTVLTAHFHNTYGLGMANCYAAMEEGAEFFETSFGGLGGCPFTKSPSGNVSTEDLVHSLQRNHRRRDILIEKIIQTSKEAQIYLNNTMQSHVLKNGCLPY